MQALREFYASLELLTSPTLILGSVVSKPTLLFSIKWRIFTETALGFAKPSLWYNYTLIVDYDRASNSSKTLSKTLSKTGESRSKRR